MKMKYWLPWLVVGVVAAFAGAFLAYQLDRPIPRLTSGTWLPQARPITPIDVVDQTGASFTARELVGRPSLVFFGFTHCPDVCPTTLALLTRVVRDASVPGLRVIFVTVDPARDTPAVVRDYVAAFDPSFVGLTGTQQQIDEITLRFGVAASHVEQPGGGYTVDHSAVVFLLDARGRNVAVFTPPFDARAMVQDLRSVATELGT